MKRMLLVDDEEQIVDWLYELFRNESGLDLDVYRAYSASEAIEWLNRTILDVVITDICMPGTNGLELMKTIKNSWPECRVVILTGHNEFDYIYSANEFPEVRYLLKTECDSVIINTIKEVVKEIDIKENEREKLIDYRRQLNRLKPVLQRQLVMDLIEGVFEKDCLSKENLMKLDIEIDFEYPLFAILMGIDTIIDDMELSKKHEDVIKISTLIEDFLSPHLNIIQVVKDRTEIIILLQIRNPKIHSSSKKEALYYWERAYAQAIASLEAIQKSAKKNLNTTVSFVFEEIPFFINKLPEKYYNFRTIINTGFGSLDSMIVSSNINLIGKTKSNQSLLEKSDMIKVLNKIHHLGIYLEQGRKKEFYDIFITAVELMGKACEDYIFLAVEIYNSISSIFLCHIRNANICDLVSARINLKALGDYKFHLSWKHAAEYLINLSYLLFEIHEKENEEIINKIVKHIKSYINDNIDKELSLYRISEVVYMNPVYLSRLFKKETGLNLIDYINQKRIESAKVLLSDFNLKIQDIAYMVGCSSPNYFSRLFKVVTGTTPQSYRNQLNEGK